MSCTRGESPHCHCHSQASSWGWARQDSMPARGPRCRPGCLPLWQRPVDRVPRSSLCCSFYTVCGLEMNVKTYCGHLPFCASSAFIAWTFCWPGAGGQCCHGASMESVCREMGCADTVIGGQVRGLAPSRKKSCLRVYVSCDHARLGKSQAGRRAGSKLHYPEYLGERISVNPNRYKDFCVFALSQIYWKTFCFCFHF